MLYGAMNFPVRPILHELETISGLGFDYLELTMDPPKAHHATIHQQRDQILKKLQEFQMRLVCHLPTFVSTADLTDSLRETSVREILDSLEVAASLDPLKIVLHPSNISGLSVFVVDKAKKLAMNSLSQIVEKAEKLGLQLCIENMFPRTNSLVQPQDFIDVLEKFPSLKFTLDTGHAHIGSTGDRRNLEFLDKLGDRIAHVHASDNFGKEDNHLPIGAGTIDFLKIVKGLKAIGYDGTVTFEIFSKDRDYLRISREKFTAVAASV
jgi:sugar phosphate isomerase/epimerase